MCHVKGKWPTDHGHPLPSADRVLVAFAARLRRGYGEAAEGAANPKDIILKAGEAVANLDPEGLPDEGKALSTESWHGTWAATCRGNARSFNSAVAAIRWFSDEQVDALGDIVRRWLLGPAEPLPAAWAQSRAVFLPKSRSADIEAHRPVVPSEPLQGSIADRASPNFQGATDTDFFKQVKDVLARFVVVDVAAEGRGAAQQLVGKAVVKYQYRVAAKQAEASTALQLADL